MRAALLVSLVGLACSSPAPMVKMPNPEPMPVAPPATPAGPTLDGLVEGREIQGFIPTALYAGADGKPLGARFVHARTKFEFDYLRIESAPQGFLWVKSYPTSDKGEPHTQEHLLLGKGNRGRKLGSSEAMALAESSAFTDQWRTCYHFHTIAGTDVYWGVFADHLDAMLNPDYTDEEIRREVRNFGVDKGDDGTLRLEEKGTVYNEMVRTYESPATVIWRSALRMVYGKQHPLAFESGGYPDDIRAMTVADIRAFHTATHHLGNMGMIGAYPSTMPLAQVLDRTAQILEKAAGRTGATRSEADLPTPAAAPPGAIELVDYPFATTTNPTPLMLVYPATRKLDSTERVALGLFLDAFAGDESTPLYKKLVDSKTRVIDTGANAVGNYVSDDQGQPVLITLDGVRSEQLDAKVIEQIRALVRAELAKLAQLPDGHAELVAFNRSVASRITDLRRQLGKSLDTPPGFGIRGTGPDWMNLLDSAQRSPGFTKSLVFERELAAIEQLARGTANPWRARIAAWGLLDVPYGVGAKPSPARRKQLDTERTARIAAELARLKTHYKTKDTAATLARLKLDEDLLTKQIDADTQQTQLPPLVATPPMTKDDGLAYTVGEIAATDILRATFDTMASARVSVAFGLGTIDPADHWYLALLPSLMTEAGVIEGGVPIAADEMRERLRKEILELSVYYSVSQRTSRVELVIAGAGNTPEETRKAIAWMTRVMKSPDWRIENLPRLRDVVEQALVGLRQRMTGPEEHWVTDPRDAWSRQGSALYLHTASFLTMAHDIHRLRWMLQDPRDPAATDEAAQFLALLAEAKTLPRAQLVELAAALGAGQPKPAPKYARWLAAAAKLSPKAAPIARDAGRDLAELLGDLPDRSLAKDWSYLCNQMAKDLRAGAPAALARLTAVREAMQQGDNARIVEVGSKAHQAAIEGDLTAFVRTLVIPQRGNRYASAAIERPLVARLGDHDPKPGNAEFVGLVAPSTSSGVFVNSAPTAGYRDTSDDAVVDYLTSNLYTGHGAHSIFMKTWAAGLAYSNGLRPDIAGGELNYYAERCPLLPQTLRFVIDELKKGTTADPNIARYAIAGAFDSRIAQSYEGRAAAMATDLADGLDSAMIRTFRTKILELAKRPDLADLLFARMLKVYARVLPGLGELDPRATYFVIGPTKQLDAYQQYLDVSVRKGTVLHRIYPRDFWIPAP